MKLLYDTQTGAVLSWPRGDEEDVVGLASHLLPVEAIDQPLPDVGRWQVISAAAPQVDVEARTVTRGWVVTDVEPVVTQRGLRRALSAAGLLEQVETGDGDGRQSDVVVHVSDRASKSSLRRGARDGVGSNLRTSGRAVCGCGRH